MDLRGHKTDSKTKFLSSESYHWLASYITN